MKFVNEQFPREAYVYYKGKLPDHIKSNLVYMDLRNPLWKINLFREKHDHYFANVAGVNIEDLTIEHIMYCCLLRGGLWVDPFVVTEKPFEEILAATFNSKIGTAFFHYNKMFGACKGVVTEMDHLFLMKEQGYPDSFCDDFYTQGMFGFLFNERNFAPFLDVKKIRNLEASNVPS